MKRFVLSLIALTGLITLLVELGGSTPILSKMELAWDTPVKFAECPDGQTHAWCHASQFIDMVDAGDSLYAIGTAATNPPLAQLVKVKKSDKTTEVIARFDYNSYLLPFLYWESNYEKRKITLEEIGNLGFNMPLASASSGGVYVGTSRFSGGVWNAELIYYNTEGRASDKPIYTNSNISGTTASFFGVLGSTPISGGDLIYGITVELKFNYISSGSAFPPLKQLSPGAEEFILKPFFIEWKGSDSTKVISTPALAGLDGKEITQRQAGVVSIPFVNKIGGKVYIPCRVGKKYVNDFHVDEDSRRLVLIRLDLTKKSAEVYKEIDNFVTFGSSFVITSPEKFKLVIVGAAKSYGAGGGQQITLSSDSTQPEVKTDSNTGGYFSVSQVIKEQDSRITSKSVILEKTSNGTWRLIDSSKSSSSNELLSLGIDPLDRIYTLSRAYYNYHPTFFVSNKSYIFFENLETVIRNQPRFKQISLHSIQMIENDNLAVTKDEITFPSVSRLELALQNRSADNKDFVFATLFSHKKVVLDNNNDIYIATDNRSDAHYKNAIADPSEAERSRVTTASSWSEIYKLKIR